MAIDMKFVTGAGNAGDGSTHDLIRNFPSFIVMGAGDIIVVHTGGATTGGGFDIPVVSDNISGTTGWIRLGDSNVVDSAYRTTKWWKLCVGGEDTLTVDWVTPGTDRCFVGVICRGLGSLNEAYLIGEGLAVSHFSSAEFGKNDGSGLHEHVVPSGDGQIYIGCTAIGAFNWDSASIQGVGTHDNNGPGGDGENGGAGRGVGVIMHINDSAGSHTTGDELRYSSHPIEPTWDSFIGIREAVAPVDNETYFALTTREGGTSYVSVDGDWGNHQNDANSDAHTDLFMNDAAGHLTTDLPEITITRDGPPGAAYCFMVAAGDTSAASINHVFGNTGNGDNVPDATFTDFTPSLGALLLLVLTVDNDGVLNDYSGPISQGYVLLGESGAYGTHTHSYLFAKFPSSSDSGPDDRFNFHVSLTGTNIHWVIQGYDVDGLGSTQGVYILDQGLMGTSGNTKTFTASKHGSLTPPAPDPPVNTVSPFIDNTTPVVGDTLTGDPGTWTGTAPITYTYQWLNYDGTDHNLSGETAITYVVTEDVVGTAIWLDVRAHSAAVAEPGVEAISDHTDNVTEAPPSGTDYTDAATSKVIGIVSGAESFHAFVPDVTATTVFDVGDHSGCSYVRAGRENVLTLSTEDNNITFQVQVSPDGLTWYDLINISPLAVTAAGTVAVTIPPGVFYWRVKCTVADDGPATCRIGTQGGY